MTWTGGDWEQRLETGTGDHCSAAMGARERACQPGTGREGRASRCVGTRTTTIRHSKHRWLWALGVREAVMTLRRSCHSQRPASAGGFQGAAAPFSHGFC